MSFKLLGCLLLHILAISFSQNVKDNSKNYAIKLEDHPYLALIEVKLPNGKSNYYNGAFASLTWVITDSSTMAHVPSGEPKNDSFLVHGSLRSLDKISAGLTKKVNKIVSNTMDSNNNMYFPNLVLLRLESPFSESKTLKPASFNIGMLSTMGTVVGWATDPNYQSTLSHPVSVQVRTLSSKVCSQSFALVEFQSQVCCICKQRVDGTFVLLEGALLVDGKHFVTALLQFNSYLKFDSPMPVMILVRLAEFKEYWEYNVLVPQPKTIFIKTWNDEDDMELTPWDLPKEVNGAKSLLTSFWTYIVDSSLAAVVLLHTNFLLS